MINLYNIINRLLIFQIKVKGFSYNRTNFDFISNFFIIKLQ
jgi:hypothetical protein